jgi:hypothetical protein
MMSMRVRTLLALGALALAVPPSSASAQDDRQTDVSAGYLNVQRTMHGWYAQLSTEVTRHFGFVAQVDGSYGPDSPGEEPDYRDHAFLGGARFTYRLTPGVSVFFHGLGGLLYSVAGAYSYEVLSLGRVVVISYDDTPTTYLALQPGGGGTFMVTRRFGIRAQADVQFAFAGEGVAMFPRVAAGGVVRIGGGV